MDGQLPQMGFSPLKSLLWKPSFVKTLLRIFYCVSSDIVEIPNSPSEIFFNFWTPAATVSRDFTKLSSVWKYMTSFSEKLPLALFFNRQCCSSPPSPCSSTPPSPPPPIPDYPIIPDTSTSLLLCFLPFPLQSNTWRTFVLVYVIITCFIYKYVCHVFNRIRCCFFLFFFVIGTARAMLCNAVLCCAVLC